MSELIKDVNIEELRAEADRCLKCKVPRCRRNCPISTDIPTVMKLFTEGNEREAGNCFSRTILSAQSALSFALMRTTVTVTAFSE